MDNNAAPQPAVQMERMIDGWFVAGMEDEVCPYEENSLPWKWWHRGEAAALAEGAKAALADGDAEQALINLEGCAH